jgi:predicted transcriptional regulator
MINDYEKTAADFLELSSEQRLSIIFRLLEKKSNISTMSKELESTMPEVYRNFERLVKAGLICKDSDGYYSLTTYGKAVCSHIPSLSFLSYNKKYFKDHDFGDLPQKYIQRIGALKSGKFVKGFTKVLECWRDICENADQYIYDILYEEPLELVEPIASKAKNGVKINSIFSDSTIIPRERKKIVEKYDIKKLIENGSIQRRIKNDTKVVVILNEKEACVIFPTIDGETDMSSTFYSNKPLFHEWCLDYFRDCWDNSRAFHESKILEK